MLEQLKQNSHHHESIDRNGQESPSSNFEHLTSSEPQINETQPVATQFSKTSQQTTVMYQLQLGHGYFEQGQFDAAIVHYRHALSTDPTRTDIYQYLAETLSKVGKLSEAAACYRQAIELATPPEPGIMQSTSNLQPQQERANTNHSSSEHTDCLPNELSREQGGDRTDSDVRNSRRSGNKRSKNKKSGTGFAKPQADKVGNEISSIAGQDSTYYLTKAENYYQQGDWKEAATYCRHVLQIQSSASAYKLLGNTLQRLGQFADAAESYLSALQLEPQSADIYANLGSLYAQQQHWQDAVVYYQKAITLKPDFAGVYRNLAKVWTQLGQSHQVADCWYRAFTLEPETASAEDRINLGNLLLMQNRMDEAIECYRDAIRLAPTLAGGYQNLAEALIRQGKPQEATPYYQKAQELGLEAASKPISLPANGKGSTADYPEPEQRSQAINLNAETLKQLEPELAQTYRHLIQSFQEKDKLVEVIRSSTEVLEQLEPELVQTCRDLAESFHAKGKLTEAISCYQRVVELEPNSAADRVNLGSLYAQQEQWQAAISCYQSAIALDKNLASAHWSLAKVWEEIDHPEQAAQSFLRALSLEPSWASLPDHLNLAHTLRSQGNEDAAITCYQQIVQQNVTCAEAHAALGEIFATRQQWQNSITHYQQAVLYRRDNLKDLIGLAQVFVSAQQWRKAVAVYRQILGRNLHPSNYLALAQCLEQLEDWDEAIECYQALTVHYSHWQIYHKLGDLLNQQQRWQEAIVVFRQAIDLNPNYSWSHNNLGDALIHLERWQAAAECFQKAIDLNPDFHWSHYNLGEALAKLEHWDGAIGAYQKALQLEPNLPWIHQKLGDVLRERGKRDLSIALNLYRYTIQQNPDDVQSYHKALAIEPQNAELYLGLGSALEKQGQMDGSLVFYEMARQVASHQTEQASIQQEVTSKSYCANTNLDKVLGNQSKCESETEFDWEFYIEHYEDLSYINTPEKAFEHWILHGCIEGRFPSKDALHQQYKNKIEGLPEDFNYQEYLELNPDLQQILDNPEKAALHFLNCGRSEGRLYAIKQLYFRKPTPKNPPVVTDIVRSSSGKVECVAVLVHIYYFDLWAEIRDYLKKLTGHEFDLFINVVESIWTPDIHDQIRQDYPDAKIIITKNRGKDIGGQITLMGHLDWKKYDLFCLIHTKKSPHISQLASNKWRNDLLDAMLGTSEKVSLNLAILRNNESIGLLGSCHWRNTEILGNSEKYLPLLDEFQIKPEARSCEYLSGTMMFVKPQIMRPIYEKFSDVELEDGDGKTLDFHVDGQLAHAIERIIGNLVRHQNMKFYWQE